MKRAAIYCRVSTADQHPETQLYDLREMAKQRELLAKTDSLRVAVHNVNIVVAKQPASMMLVDDAPLHKAINLARTFHSLGKAGAAASTRSTISATALCSHVFGTLDAIHPFYIG